MATNVNYLQKNVSLEAVLYTGSQSTYVTRIIEAALRKALGKDFKSYEVTNGGNTVKLTGEGPYSKSKLFNIVRQAMLKRIKKRYSKFRTEVKSPLTITIDYPRYFS